MTGGADPCGRTTSATGGARCSTRSQPPPGWSTDGGKSAAWGCRLGCGREALRRLIPPISYNALMGLWNYRTCWALSFMSNTFSRAGHQQVAETSRKSDALKGELGIAPELDAAPKATRPKWRTRLQRELLKIWLAFSAPSAASGPVSDYVTPRPRFLALLAAAAESELC